MSLPRGDNAEVSAHGPALVNISIHFSSNILRVTSLGHMETPDVMAALRYQIDWIKRETQDGLN